MSQDTREKILAAATRLFAESDSSGVALRAIAREAGVNSALIHYHFGSREGLFEAAFLRALEPIQARRHVLIDALRAEGPPSPAQLARLFVVPLLPTGDEDRESQATALRLLARAFAERRGVAQDITLKNFGPVMYALGDLLGEALPGLPPEIKHRRMRFCVQAALETLSGPEMDAAKADGEAARDALVAELIAFLAGGLEAATPATRRK